MISQQCQWSDNALPALVPASFNHDSDDEDVCQSHVSFDIHQYFGLSPGTPICLDSLQDPAPGQKPAYTYATLVKLAIWSSPQRRLTLSGIYAALENRFPWFKECENPNAWKTSIRHSLSLLSVFVKLPMEVHLPGKGHYWTVDFTKGDGYKRPRKRGKKPSKNASDVSDTGPSSSVHAPVPYWSKRRSIPSDISQTWTANPQSWQTATERASRVFAPYGKPIPLAAASPEPQFRHYRMCTYLYPDTKGAPAPAPAMHIWSAEEQKKDKDKERNEQGQGLSQRRHPAQVGLDPFMGASPQDAASSSGHYLTFRATDDAHDNDDDLAEGRYFQPSPASYQAYHVASNASHKAYVWVASADPVGSTTTRSKGDTMMHARDYKYEEDEDEDDHASIASNGVSRPTSGNAVDHLLHSPCAHDDGTDPSFLDADSHVASPRSDIESEEEVI